MTEPLMKTVGDNSGESILIAAGVHGNETGGVKAVNRFLGGALDFNSEDQAQVLQGRPEYPIESGSVTFMLANPGALRINQRSVDEDLVEVLGPETDRGDSYEAELAEEIDDILPEMDYVLDLHGSENVGGEPVLIMNPRAAPSAGRTAADPHVVMYDFDPDSVELAKLTGLDEVRDYEKSPSHDDRAGFFRYDKPAVVATETGPRGRNNSAETSYKILENVLAGLGVIKTDYETGNPEVSGIESVDLQEYAETRI